MNMNSRIRRALSVMIVVMMLVTPFFVMEGGSAENKGMPEIKADGIDLVIGPGVTFIIDENTIDPITGQPGKYGQDGNITVQAGGTLIVRNATLYFLQDDGSDVNDPSDDHHYSLTVESGGTFIMDNGTLKTVDWAVNPYLKLPVTINGRAIFTDSVVSYPGTFTVDNGVLYANNTVFRGLRDITNPYIEDVDDNDDCPIMNFVNSHTVFADSRVEDYYSYKSTITTIFVPATAGALDTTGEEVGNLSEENEGRTYPVEPGERLYIDSFSPSEQLPFWVDENTPVYGAVLYVSWLGDPAYNGTASVFAGLDGGPLENTSIQPDSVAGKRPYSIDASTVGDILNMDVSFIHNGDSGSLPFDSIYLEVNLYKSTNISVVGGDFHAINTYLGVDFRELNATNNAYDKCSFVARNNADVRMYNVTVNEDATNNLHPYFAFFTDHTSTIYLYGWASITTIDGNDMDPTPVPFCRIYSEYYAPSPEAQQITEENNTLHNGDPVLEYMDRMSSRDIDENNYNITDADGKLMLPLLKNYITDGDLNGQFVGNYFVTAHENIQGTDTTKQVNFRPYPNITAEDNIFASNFAFSWSYPPRDLAISPADISADPVVRGDTAVFNVTIHNIGGINVTQPFSVSLFVDGILTDVVGVDSMVERNGGTVNAELSWTTGIGDYGDHNVTVVVDELQNINDGNRSNNNASINFHVDALYDLYVDPATIWWENTTYGDTYTDTTLTIHATVTNGGAGDITGDIKVNFYVNGVGISATTIPGMLSGASVGVTAEYTTSVPGDYNVSVIVSSPSGVYDDIQDNNRAYRMLSTMPVPDLIVSGMNIPDSAIEGFDTAISVTVLNNGDTYANGTITATFMDLTAGTTIGSATYTGLLLPGQVAEIPINWVPTEPMGDHTLSVSIVFANNTGEPPETVVDNNAYTSTAPVDVQLAYDLGISPTDISWNPENPLTYQDITISAVIHNNGERDINTTFIVRFEINGIPFYVDVDAVDAGENITASITYSTTGSGYYDVVVTIDATGVVPEYNEDNNVASASIFIGPRPEFSVASVYIIGAGNVVENHEITVVADIINNGASATGMVSVYFYDGNPDTGGIQIGYQEFYDPGQGWRTSATITWTPEGMGSHTIYARIVADTTPPEGNTMDNTGHVNVNVLPRPDLVVTDIQFLKPSGEINSTSECRDFDINVTIANTGGLLSDSRVYGFTISIFNGAPLAGDWSNLLTNISVGNESIPVLDEGQPVSFIYTFERFTFAPGTANIYAVVDSGDVVDESDEANNAYNETIDILQMQLRVVIWTPNEQTDINMDEMTSITVTGQIIDDTDGQPVDNIPMTISLVDTDTGAIGPTTSSITWVSNRNNFMATLATPGAPGTYMIQVSATTPDGETITVGQSGTHFSVVRPVEESSMFWIIALIAIIVVLAMVGGGLFYLKKHYAGKYVECGSCGRMIPAGSDKCQYCGAVFDKETVKCSSCGAWIPADAKECPKCGAKFLVSGKEIVDYETQMKEQYEAFVEKFRKQAKKEMGDEFTEEKFQQWWRTQKSYVTFEDWLKREEERKKTGGIICPHCGALNSKTDIVCHVCGSPLRKTKKKKSSADVEGAAISTIELPSLEKKEEGKEEESKPEEKKEKTESAAEAKPVVAKKVVKKKVVKTEAAPEEKKESSAAELPDDLIVDMKKSSPEDAAPPEKKEEPKPAAPQKKVVAKKVVKKKVVKK